MKQVYDFDIDAIIEIEDIMKNIDEKKKVYHIMHGDEYVSEHNTHLDALQQIGWKSEHVRPLLKVKPVMKHNVITYSEIV